MGYSEEDQRALRVDELCRIGQLQILNCTRDAAHAVLAVLRIVEAKVSWLVIQQHKCAGDTFFGHLARGDALQVSWLFCGQ